MPEKQKIDLWDFWDAAQKFINSCFQNILAEVSKMEEDKHIGIVYNIDLWLLSYDPSEFLTGSTTNQPVQSQSLKDIGSGGIVLSI